jgi:hypothetical protein
MEIKFSRKWQMANAETFSIPAIKSLIANYVSSDMLRNCGDWIDPFCRDSIFKKQMKFSNDANPDFAGTHNMDALDFLKLFPDQSFDGVLFDPPFSPRQAKEEYQGFGSECPDTTRAFWADRKTEAARVVKINGYAICCGWTSGGLGMKNGFELKEVLLVCHGQQNDTIVTVEQKTSTTLPTDE